MEGSFNYFYTTQSNGTIDIKDIGNCAIDASTDNGAHYYLIIKTSLGFTRILSYGPLTSELALLPKSTSIKFNRIEYNEGKIQKQIESFLGNPYANITQAIEVDPNELLDKCVDIIEYMKQEDAF